MTAMNTEAKKFWVWFEIPSMVITTGGVIFIHFDCLTTYHRGIGFNNLIRGVACTRVFHFRAACLML